MKDISPDILHEHHFVFERWAGPTNLGMKEDGMLGYNTREAILICERCGKRMSQIVRV